VDGLTVLVGQPVLRTRRGTDMDGRQGILVDEFIERDLLCERVETGGKVASTQEIPYEPWGRPVGTAKGIGDDARGRGNDEGTNRQKHTPPREPDVV